MLDNLRGMAVFASVVNQESFSGAARDLGITTSAVSQQIRTLENELGVVLLHRSTRKLSLTEAGEGFYQAAKDVVAAAEQGRILVTQLKNELAGSLRLATTPELAIHHIMPALSNWIESNEELKVTIFADSNYIDMIDKRIDIAVRISHKIEDMNLTAHPLADVRQILVASPEYLKKSQPIDSPKDLKQHELICINLMKDCAQLEFVDKKTSKKSKVKMPSRFMTNNVMLARDMTKNGYGIMRLRDLDAQELLKSGELVEVLADYELPSYILYAITLAREQQPAKVTRCLEVLRTYFDE